MTQLAIGYSPVRSGATNPRAPLPLYGTAYGCVADGDVDAGTGTDNATALQALLTDAIATGRPAFLPSGVYRYTTQVNATGGFTLIGEPGTVLFKDHSDRGLSIAPSTIVTGTVTAQADNGKVKVSGATFTADAYAGHYCQVTTNDSGSVARLQRRKILSNTSDTLTLEYDLALTPLTGDAVEIEAVLSGIAIENITVQAGTAGGLAGIDVAFADDVRLTNVRAIGHGSDGFSINTGRNIRLENCRGEDSFFGIFVYNCDDALVTNCAGVNASDAFHIELKDCRDSAMVGCYAEGGASNSATSNGLHLHSSGLNPCFNVRILGGSALNMPGQGMSVLATDEEAAGGTFYEPRNVSVSGTVIGNGGTSTGVEFINEGNAVMRNAQGHALTVFGTQVGLLVEADDAEVSDFSIEQCTAHSVDGISADRVRLANGIVKDGNMGGTASREVGLSACSDWTVTNVSAIHTNASSASDGFVTESSTSDRNHYIDCRALDTDSAYTGHYGLVGTSSQVAHTIRTHQSMAYAASVTPSCDLGEIVDIGTLTGNITIGAPTHPLRGLRLTLNFTQDATGGRTITLNSVFKTTWTPVTTANARNTITFEYDGTNWIQQYATVGF